MLDSFPSRGSLVKKKKDSQILEVTSSHFLLTDGHFRCIIKKIVEKGQMRMTQKRMQKRRMIEECAKGLFLKNDAVNTSVDEIAALAGIAKGTFYLYFKDKEELIGRVVNNLCVELLEKAFLHTQDALYSDIIQRLIAMAEYIIDYYEENPCAIRLVKNNLSVGLLQKEIYNLSELDFKGIWTELVAYCKQKGFSRRETYDRLYLIVELTSSATYFSIVEGKPDSIEQMKPIILDNVKRLLG
jgi:transcriptional regulator, tetR family